MARQTQTVEVNSFVRGLITEASPLTFPDNASLDEDNFNLRRDGSRDRRLGMDYEEGFQTINTGIDELPTGELAVSTFSWKNAGGIPEKTFIVVQTGNVVKVFDPDVAPLSSGEIFSVTLPVAEEGQVFSYANVDGTLVIATGAKQIQIFNWDGTNVTRTTDILKIRDQFGVEDKVGGRDLTEGTGLQFRPTSLSNAHTYNLRNQTFAMPREMGDISGRDKFDTLQRVFSVADVYPSNADNVHLATYPNPNDSGNRTGDQFFAKDLENNPPGTFPSPKGFFVIDAMDRGASRLEEVQQLEADNPELTRTVSNLPTDSTPGGPTAVAEYAGRVWYGGFSGELVGGDEKSPRLSSYIMFSQLVQDPTAIVKCYQEGDPTSKEAPDLLDTDGGFIRVDGAYNIQGLVNIGTGIAVIAENGVWMISGGSDFGFTANNNMRRKISEQGIQSPGSVVVVDNTFLFWSDDAIYHIAPDEFGDIKSNNLTQTTIQSFYDQINPIDKFFAQGAYDSYDRKVRWVYNNRISDELPAKELILDMTLGAFYTHTLESIGGSIFPKLAAPLEVPPFRLTETQTPVTEDGEPVENDGEQVTQLVSVRGSATRELAYIVLTGADPVTYTIGLYRDPTFVDWASEDGVGVDAEAFLVTGYMSGGDFLRYKQAPYIQFYFTRTEDGFTDDGTGNLFPTNESSCIVQSQWEWANSANSNRWGREFQAYKYRRLYMPADVNDPFDNGFEVITTKNKLRGKGKVLSLKMRTEPGKDLRLLGWSMIVGVTGNV